MFGLQAQNGVTSPGSHLGSWSCLPLCSSTRRKPGWRGNHL